MGRQSLFREESMEHVSSPEQLDQYLRVSSPRAWVAIVVLALLIVAGFSFLALVDVSVTERTTIVVEDGRVSGSCDLPDGTYETEVFVGERRLLDLALGL